MTNKLNIFLHIFLALFCISLLFSPVFAQDSSGGVGIKPANPRPDNPRSSSIFTYTAIPGEEIKDSILISNNSDRKTVVNLFHVDSEIASGGSFTCKQNNETPIDVGSWIKLNEKELTLESGKTKTVEFTISIPKNVPVGESNGCIILQEKKAPSTTSQPGIQLTVRSGIRVAILIPGEISRELTLLETTYKLNDKKNYVFNTNVKNTGNVSTDSSIKLNINNLFNQKVGELGGQYPVLRGTTSTYNFEFKSPSWGGYYFVTPVLEYDPGKNAGIGVSSGESLKLDKGDTITIFIMPDNLALTIYAVILALFGVLLFAIIIKIRFIYIVKNNWIDYKIRNSEDIVDLSDRLGLSWKKVAKANKLKPPYKLSNGTIIKIPPKKT